MGCLGDLLSDRATRELAGGCQIGAGCSTHLVMHREWWRLGDTISGSFGDLRLLQEKESVEHYDSPRGP